MVMQAWLDPKRPESFAESSRQFGLRMKEIIGDKDALSLAQFLNGAIAKVEDFAARAACIESFDISPSLETHCLKREEEIRSHIARTMQRIPESQLNIALSMPYGICLGIPVGLLTMLDACVHRRAHLSSNAVRAFEEAFERLKGGIKECSVSEIHETLELFSQNAETALTYLQESRIEEKVLLKKVLGYKKLDAISWITKQVYATKQGMEYARLRIEEACFGMRLGSFMAYRYRAAYPGWLAFKGDERVGEFG